MSWVVTAVVVATTAGSIYQSNKSARAQRKQREVQQKIDERSRKREQLAQLRQAQIARAQATQAAVNTGTGDSTGYLGQVASIQSTAMGNVAFTQQVQSGADQMAMWGNKAAHAATMAGNWQAVSSLASNFIQPIPTQKPKADPNKPAGTP